MKSRWKVLIGLALLALGLGLWVWLRSPLWLEQFNERQSEARATFQAQGRLFGQHNDQQACLAQTLKAFDGCSGFDCTLQHDYFLKACLAEAAPSPGFCDGVPAYRVTPTEDDKSWAKYACWDGNIRGEGCRMLMRQQQYECSGGVAADAPAQ
ncbi:hypothetical protein [Marinobacterium rhizophilum]|uniref:hypothetical protein n=1 Tax=Marinobacterium rhizophilum TaxID=420402 RepID=UPI0003807DA3|nr:hypothetical protein [Marinobacterium rhizophilum]